MLKTIIEEARVTEALKRGSIVYPRTLEAYDAMCWMLARSQVFGAELPSIKQVYKLHKQASGGFGVPELTVLYTATSEHVHLHALRVG